MVERICGPGKILNPATNRCVDENGRTGKMIQMKMMQNKKQVKSQTSSNQKTLLLQCIDDTQKMKQQLQKQQQIKQQAKQQIKQQRAKQFEELKNRIQKYIPPIVEWDNFLIKKYKESGRGEKGRSVERKKRLEKIENDERIAILACALNMTISYIMSKESVDSVRSVFAAAYTLALKSIREYDFVYTNKNYYIELARILNPPPKNKHQYNAYKKYIIEVGGPLIANIEIELFKFVNYNPCTNE